MKRIPRHTFTAEFKAEAIKLVTEQKLTPAEVSRKLDIATKSLRTWIEQQARHAQCQSRRRQAQPRSASKGAPVYTTHVKPSLSAQAQIYPLPQKPS
jgi:transposase-like protein